MTKRRGSNEGSIYKRADGRWTATVNLGYEGGRRRRKAVYGKTRAEVGRQLTPLLQAHAQGVPLGSPGTLTLGQLLNCWLEAVMPTVRESTYIGYEVQIRKHIMPVLGKVRLARLEARELQALYQHGLSAGLSPRSVGHQHKVLRMALALGVKWGLVARNVADLANPPRVPESPAKTFSVEQAKAFLAAVIDDRLYALYVVSLACGLRRGEVLALSWDSIDLEGGTLAVKQTLSKVKGGWRFTEPKTRSGRRVVKLPQGVSQAFRQHRIQQVQERLSAGPEWSEAGLVFTTTRGTAIDGDNLRRAYQAHLRKAGLPVISFHSLRHSAATFMLALGVQPKVVAEMLGHSRISVTMDTYSHVLPHLQDEAAVKMDGLLRP